MLLFLKKIQNISFYPILIFHIIAVIFCSFLGFVLILKGISGFYGNHLYIPHTINDFYSMIQNYNIVVKSWVIFFKSLIELSIGIIFGFSSIKGIGGFLIK